MVYPYVRMTNIMTTYQCHKEEILAVLFNETAERNVSDVLLALSSMTDDSVLRHEIEQCLVYYKVQGIEKCTSSHIVHNEKIIKCSIEHLVSVPDNNTGLFPQVDGDIIERVCMDFIAKSKKTDDAPTRARVHSQIMKSNSRLVVLGGAPGTAKSSTAIELMKAYRKYRSRHMDSVSDTEQDYGLWVLAMNPFAMEKWRGRSGVQGATIDQVLVTQEMGVETIPKGAFVVVDEAGLIGTEKMALLLDKAVKEQWQKLVLMGDIKQDLPAEYGQPLAYMIRQYPEISFELKTPFRQRNEEERQFVQNLYDGRCQEALQHLSDHDNIVLAPEKEVAAILVQSFVQWRCNVRNRDKQCLILVQDYKIALALNEAVIECQQFEKVTNNIYPYQGPLRTWNLGVGDRVMLQQEKVVQSAGKRMSLGPGTMGIIVYSDSNRMDIRIDWKGSDKVYVTIQRDIPHQISPAYALTFSQAQGIAADYTAVYISQPVNGASMISACSRHRYRCQIFINNEIYKTLDDFINAIKHFPTKAMPYLDNKLQIEDKR